MVDEMTNEDDFNKFMDQMREQQNRLANTPPGGAPQDQPQGGTPVDFQANKIVQNLNTQSIDPTKNAIRPSQGECPQCNTFHPPLGVGESCPMTTETSGITGEQIPVMSDADINKYLVNLKNILMANIKTKELKDPGKLFQQVTLKVAEFLEGYKE